jgi:hypothetical protein
VLELYVVRFERIAFSEYYITKIFASERKLLFQLFILIPNDKFIDLDLERNLIN